MARTREEMLAALRGRPDVQILVIGGGINGISVFRELALQGVDVLLVDRGDFCGACSSAPSRMIHGGLRYLENGEIGLVREALRERDALLRNAPHLVRPLPTTVPIQHMFSGLMNSAFGVLGLRSSPAERGAIAVKLGLTFYDVLSRARRIMPPHVFRGRKATAELWPALPPSVRYSATYHDAWISYPERLGIELVREGVEAGGLAVNHLAVSGRDGNSFLLTDTLTGEPARVTPTVVVNATGAWVDETNATIAESGKRPESLVGGTKGSHLVLEHPELLRALNGHMIYFENIDGRVCIVFPYLDRVLLGSTDIRVDRPAEVRCEDSEVAYILKSLSYVFPGITVRDDQIVYRYSGVRPLPRSDAGFTGRISRDHFVAEMPGTPHVLSLVGGKWTTFRAFGEQVADKALAVLGVKRTAHTDERPIGGGAGFPSNAAGQDALVAEIAVQCAVSVSRAAHAVTHYGTDARRALEYCRTKEDRPIAGTDYTEMEMRYLIRCEHARSLSDLLQRRTSLAIRGDLSDMVIARTAAILSDELNWPSDKTAREEAEFRQLLARDHGITAAILAGRDKREQE